LDRIQIGWNSIFYYSIRLFLLLEERRKVILSNLKIRDDLK